MKTTFFVVFCDGKFVDEIFASRTGAKSFIRICKKYDKMNKVVAHYEIEEAYLNSNA